MVTSLHQGLAMVNARIDRLFTAMMSGVVLTLGRTVGFFPVLLN
jgi:hypothetical protein